MRASFEIPEQNKEYEAYKLANPVHKLSWKGRTIEVLTGDDMSPALSDEMQKLNDLFKSKK
jgi:hypothetical protein